jgi:hypothetical protein
MELYQSRTPPPAPKNPWVRLPANEMLPANRRGPAPYRRNLSQGNAKIKAPVSRGLSVEPIALIIVKPWRGIMVHRNRRIIQDSPSRTLYRQAGNHVVMHLRAGAAQPLVKPNRAYRRHPECTVHTFKKVYIPGRTSTNMMITDSTAEPQEAANQSAVPVLHCIGLMHPVPPANGPKRLIACEMCVYTKQPIRPRRRIVIRNGHNLATAMGKPGIKRLHLARDGHRDDLKRQMLLRGTRHPDRFVISSPHHNHHLMRFLNLQR